MDSSDDDNDYFGEDEKILDYEECLGLLNSDDRSKKSEMLNSLAHHAKHTKADSIDEILKLVLAADKKETGVADYFWNCFYCFESTGKKNEIDFILAVIEQRGPDAELKFPLDGNNLEFHLHESIDKDVHYLIKAIDLGIDTTVMMALEHWTNPAITDVFPWDRLPEILSALRKSPSRNLNNFALQMKDKKPRKMEVKKKPRQK